MPRVAVIGSGPAGIYAAEALTREGGLDVDVLDRLPCPFGLVRYGVAPDHLKIRSISAALAAVLEHSGVRFLGNVDIGADVSLEELQRFYDAVILAYGSAVDRRMGVPGEDLPGSFSATDFVAWYNGHPDAPIDRFTLAADSVAVVGMGNVAVDVVRILAKATEVLRKTDLPDHVLSVLDRSEVSDIHMVGRRGPVQGKFTTKELRELGELPGVDVVVRPEELAIDPVSERLLATSPASRRNLDVLREWAQRPLGGGSRRLHLHFWLQPAAVLGGTQVSGLRLERTRPDADGNAIGTGETRTIDAQMVLRSVGYRGLPLPGLPFDQQRGTVPNAAGRVLVDGQPLPGVYVAGWIKRGPTGVIGTNKHDARETVTALLDDLPGLSPAEVSDPDGLLQLLAQRGVSVVTWQGWQAIERAEAELGAAAGRERSRIADRAALLRAAAGSQSVPH